MHHHTHHHFIANISIEHLHLLLLWIHLLVVSKDLVHYLLVVFEYFVTLWRPQFFVAEVFPCLIRIYLPANDIEHFFDSLNPPEVGILDGREAHDQLHEFFAAKVSFALFWVLHCFFFLAAT